MRGVGRRIGQDTADGMKQEVYSKDRVMHIGISYRRF